MRFILSFLSISLLVTNFCFALNFDWMESTRSSAFSNGVGGVVGVEPGIHAVFENPSLLNLSGVEIIGFGTETEQGVNVKSMGAGIGTDFGSFGVGVIQTADAGMFAELTGETSNTIDDVVSNKLVFGYSISQQDNQSSVGLGINLMALNYASYLKNNHSIDACIGFQMTNNGDRFSVMIDHVLGSTFETFFGKVETLSPSIIFSGKKVFDGFTCYGQLEMGNNTPLVSYGLKAPVPLLSNVSLLLGNKNDVTTESSGLFALSKNSYHAPSVGLQISNHNQVFDYGVTFFSGNKTNHYFSTRLAVL